VDTFPNDDARITRDLQRGVAAAQQSANRHQPLTAASKGWIVGNNPPDPSELGSGEVWIGANGAGQLVAMDESGGTTVLEPPPPPPFGSTPQYPTSFESPASVTGTVTDTVYNALRRDCAMLQVCIRSIINNGAAMGLWPAP
jgi:hypothetical protein